MNRVSRVVGTTMAIVVLAHGGCVKRKETITVSADGSTTIRLKYEGDRSDLQSGAPEIAPARGWEYDESLKIEDDGKETLTVTASTSIPAGAPLPTTYPLTDPSAVALVVQHPTTLTIERGRDGRYFHFRRTYVARPWAYVAYWYKTLIEKPLQRGGDHSLDEMSAEKKQELVNNIISFQGVMHIEILRRALREAEPALSQDARLRVERAVREVVDAVDTTALLALLDEQDDEGADAVLKERARQLNDDLVAAERAAFAELNLSNRSHAFLEQAVRDEFHRYEFTEDYGGESWEITVIMPGRIVGHNGDKVEGNSVSWEFEGASFQDREMELMVTSFVRAGDLR